MGSTPAHPDHDNFKSCHVTSTSWNTPALPNDELSEFLDRGRSCDSFWRIRIMIYGPRREMRNRKHSWEKLRLKCAWFRSFRPFLEYTDYLHWPKEGNAIPCPSVNMWFWISGKISAYQHAEKHWKIFACILTIHWSQFATFFRKDWIRKSSNTAISTW
jgi:hypothetical protein